MPGEFEGHDISGMADAIGADLGFSSDDSGKQNDPIDEIVDGGTAPAPAPTAPTPAPVSAAPAPNPTTAPAMPPAPTPRDPNQPPNSWTAEAKAAWATLPENIRAEVHRREDNFFQGIEQYRQGAELGKQFQSVMAEYMPILQQHNIDPFQQISGLMRAHHTLALGAPEQKIQLFRQLANDYGVDLGQLAPTDPNAAPYEDPAVAALRQELASLKSQLTTREQREQTAQRQQISRQIEDFAKTHEDFDTLSNEIAVLIQSGQDLQTAYDNARWMNPVTRAKLVEQQAKDAVAAREKADREAAAKAAKAARPRIPAKSVSPTVAAGSIDETLANQLAEIRARQ